MTRDERIECTNSLIRDVRAESMSDEISSRELSFLEIELRLLTLINDLERWCREERDINTWTC